MNDDVSRFGSGDAGERTLDDQAVREVLQHVRATFDVNEGWARLQGDLSSSEGWIGDGDGVSGHRNGSAPRRRIPAGRVTHEDMVVVEVAPLFVPRRGNRHGWLAVAAGLVAVAMMATALFLHAVLGGGPLTSVGPGEVSPGPDEVSPGPDEVSPDQGEVSPWPVAPPPSSSTRMVPTWVPEGLQVWGVNVPVQAEMRRPTNADMKGWSRWLFRPRGATTGGILIRYDPGQISGSMWPGVTVRGLAGYRVPMGAMGADFQIAWNEKARDVQRSVGASVQGVPEADALAMLNSLEWSTDADPTLQLPATSTWSVDGEARGWTPTPVGDAVSLVYDHPVPSGTGALHVNTGSGVGPEMWLEARFAGTRRADGGYEVLDPKQPPFQPQVFEVVWPDSTSLTLSGPAALSLDDDHRIVDSLRRVDAKDIDAFASQANVARTTLPLIASVPISEVAAGTGNESLPGRIEIRGVGSDIVGCAVFGTSPVACSQNDLGSPDNPLVGGVMIGSTWYVFGAADEPKSIQFRSGATMSLGPKLPTIQASGGGWNVAVAAVPDDLDIVNAAKARPGEEGGSIAYVARPAAN
jgi:hypothetical protein